MSSCEGIENKLDICVVGAGPHGLASLTHFLSSPEHLDRFDEHPNNSTLYFDPAVSTKTGAESSVKSQTMPTRSGRREAVVKCMSITCLAQLLHI
uniref:Uncharacterized protein n=1 Tax=Physcomitrium patens TaxID=3218 RepID=A0A2K1J9P4_PHYPA|nr:hypothetical protein PHYPA_021357 [Physcomitrium patens]